MKECLQLLLFSFFFYSSFAQHFLNERMLQSTSCPSVAMAESYSITYGTPYTITPSFSLSCGTGKAYSIQSGSITTKTQSFAFEPASRVLTLNNYAQMSNNQFYPLIFSAIAVNTATGEQVTIADSFFLVIGTVNIVYSAGASKTYKYNEDIIMSYSDAYDPQQPETGIISYSWTCDPLYQQCSSLSSSNTLDPLTRIRTSKFAFNYGYSFQVTMSNKNSKFLKSTSDTVSATVQRPEQTDQPLTCLNLTMVFKSQNYTINKVNNNELSLIFDNLNYTDIKISAPLVNISDCASLSTSKQSYLAFASFNTPDLFNDIRTYPFNNTDIVIPKSKIQGSLTGNNQQQLFFYAYLLDNTNKILGYQYQKLTLKMNDQSLYAILTKSFIQFDRDKVLYIDGSTSFDSRNIQFNYIWGVEKFPNLQFANSRVLTLTPDQRNTLGINQAGRYYNFTLRVSDSTRTSDIAKVLVQITPEADPKGCMQVGLKDIDLDKIVTYTIWPLILQAKVTKATCAGLVPGALVWSTSSVDWQFWTMFGNNYTITMDRSTLTQLPKNKDIYMSVTQYFVVNEVEYIARKTFVLFVEKSDLVPIVTYPKVINVKDTQLVLNATQSYDPQAKDTGTTDVPIKCSWKCPDYMTSVCDKATYLVNSNNCLILFQSTDIILHSNYSKLIENQAHLFTLTITKDTRSNQAFVFVTIVATNFYPKCQIDFTKDVSINQYAFALANCSSSQASQFTYSWKAYQWNNTASITAVNNNLMLTNNVLRLPPYVLQPYKDILLMVTVSNKTYSTPIALYKRINDQQGFTVGTLNKNYNQFTSYLSTFTMTPANWDSTVSSTLLYQYRMKFADNPLANYKVLLAPTVSSSKYPISINLPPLIYESALYIDAIDAENNVVTTRSPVISKSDIQMTAATFQTRVNNVISQIEYSFVEADFEQNMLRLMLTFMAYRNGDFNTQGYSDSFFKDICQSTVSYLYNTFVIDQRIKNVQLADRQIMIKQNTIETLNFIAMTNSNITNLGDLFTLLNALMVDEYYLAHMLPEMVLKVYQIIFQSTDVKYQPLTSTLVQKMLTRIMSFTYKDEVIRYQSTGGYSLVLHQIGASSSNLPDLDSIIYPKEQMYQTKYNGGMMTYIRNSTFVHFSVHDSTLALQRIGPLSAGVTISFYLTTDQIQKNSTGNLTFFCSHKDDISTSWSRISVSSYNTVTGEVVCKSNQIGAYTLFIIDLTKTSNGGSSNNNGTNGNGTNNNGTSGGGNQDVNGTWNDTLGPKDGWIQSDDYIYNQQKVVFTILAILTLLFFILSSVAFYCKYKGEHQELSRQIQNFEIFAYESLFQNRWRLFKSLLVHFSPYLNLFKVYNKFLQRWVRNSLLQIYFMTISLIYGINQTLLTQDRTTLGRADSSALIGLFIIVLIVVVLGRPWAIKLMYKLLYEPDAKVEDYNIGTTQQIEHPNFIVKDVNSIIDQKLKIVDFQLDIDDDKKQVSLSLPKLQDEGSIMQSHRVPPQESFRELPQYEQSRMTSHREGRITESNPKISEPQEPEFQQIQIGGQKRKLNSRLNKFTKKREIEEPKVNKHNLMISEQEESKIQEQSIDHASFANNLEQSQEKPLSGEKRKEGNSNSPDDYGTLPIVVSPDDKFHLPPIMQPKRQHQFDDINLKDNLYQNQEAQNNQSLHMFQTNFFDEFIIREGDENDDYNNIEMEGGEAEEVEVQDMELQRDDHSVDQVEHTLHYPTNMLNTHREAEHQNTEFVKDDQGPSNREFIDDSFKFSNGNPPEPDSVLMQEGKTLFINKMIGKLILLLIWVVLAVGNMLCIENMLPQDFYNWLILSLVTFACIILVVDPILYWILVSFMIRNKECKRVQYFTRGVSLRSTSSRKWHQTFVLCLIGREKLRDLRRVLHKPVM